MLTWKMVYRHSIVTSKLLYFKAVGEKAKPPQIIGGCCDLRGLLLYDRNLLFGWCYGCDMGVDAFVPVEETFHVDFVTDV